MIEEAFSHTAGDGDRSKEGRLVVDVGDHVYPPSPTIYVRIFWPGSGDSHTTHILSLVEFREMCQAVEVAAAMEAKR